MILQAISAILDVPVSIVDIIPDRLEAASSLGAVAALASSRENLADLKREQTNGLGFDVVVDAAGTGLTKSLSVDLCRDDGLIVWIGLGSDEVSLQTYPITLREQTVTGSYGATAEDMAEGLRLMAGGHVDVDSWVSKYQLDDAADAFLKQLDVTRRDIKAVIQIEP
jgi:threonine dehydrogenase-like Zn-dependent dehydrogenase